MKWQYRPWSYWFSSPGESRACLIVTLTLCLSFSTHPCNPSMFLCVELLLTPQNLWWCAQSGGLQAAPPVRLLLTAPSSGHSRGAALLKVCWPPSFEWHKQANKNTQLISVCMDIVGQASQHCSPCIWYSGWNEWGGGTQTTNIYQVEGSAAVLPGVWGENTFFSFKALVLAEKMTWTDFILRWWCCELSSMAQTRANTPCLRYYTFSCTSMWCTLWTVCGTVVEPCWRTGPHSHLCCCRTLPHKAQVTVTCACLCICGGAGRCDQVSYIYNCRTP